MERDPKQPVGYVSAAELRALLTELISLKSADHEIEIRKIRADTAKTHTLGVSGVLLAVVALSSFVSEPRLVVLLYLATGCLIGSAVCTLGLMYRIAWEDMAVPSPIRLFLFPHIALGLFAVGLLFFMVFIGLNSSRFGP